MWTQHHLGKESWTANSRDPSKSLHGLEQSYLQGHQFSQRDGWWVHLKIGDPKSACIPYSDLTLSIFYVFLRCHWCCKGLHWPGDICAPSISEHWTLVIACLHISPRLMQFYMMRFLIWLSQYITCIWYMFESFVICMTSLSESSSLATFAWAASET